MRIWLDDTRKMPDRYTHWCKSAEEAIELLKTGEVEEISLDYDLGDWQPTGLVVAEWIVKNLKRIRCKVHSQHPEGKEKIKEVFRKAWMK